MVGVFLISIGPSTRLCPPPPPRPRPHKNAPPTSNQYPDSPNSTGLKLSQRIIHTRVQGQASVILILALTMGFREWMTKNGGRIEYEDLDD